jgi:hypothetical protein
LSKLVEGNRVVQIHGLTFGARRICIDQNNLAGQAAQHEGIGECSADVAGTDDCDSNGFIHQATSLRANFPSDRRFWVAK